MKMIRLLLPVVGLLIALAKPMPVAAQWTRFGGSADFPVGITASSMAISPIDDSVYVAFSSYNFGHSLWVKKYNGLAWSDMGIPNFTTTVISDVSIAVNPITGEPYVGFTAGSQANVSNVMKFNGSAWVNVGSSPVTGVYGDQCILRFSATGDAYFCYTIGSLVRVARFSNNSWTMIGGPYGVVTGGFSRELDMAINPITFEPYVCFNSQSVNRAVVYQYISASSAWLQVGFIPDAGDDCRIAFDSSTGQLFVAYLSNGLVCRTFNGTNWAIVGYPVSASASNRDLSLTVNPVSHRPYIIYNDVYSYALKYDGYNWVHHGQMILNWADQFNAAFHPFTHELYYQSGNGIESENVYRFNNCTVSSNTTITACVSYPRPEYRGYYTTSGIYKDTIRSSTNCDSIATLNLTVQQVDTSVTRTNSVWTANQAGATYQWVQCWSNNPVPGATTQSLNINTTGLPGPFAVKVTLNGCTARSACPPPPLDVVMPTSGESVAIRPVPTFGPILIVAGSPVLSRARVYKITGELIGSQTLQGQQGKLELEGAAGVYILEVELASGEKRRFKVVKQ